MRVKERRRERRIEGLKKSVERRKSGKRLYSDRTWRETRTYRDLKASQLELPNYQRKFPESM